MLETPYEQTLLTMNVGSILIRHAIPQISSATWAGKATVVVVLKWSRK
jgi:hypothetical protein